jgi:hypothetical protein
LVGAAFGWVAEDFIATGYDAVAVDCSAWIHANKATEALIPILNVNILDAGAGTIIGPADWVVSEDVLPVLSNEELSGFLTATRSLAPRVAHWVSFAHPSTDEGLNRKDGAGWAAVVAPDILVRRGSSEVYGWQPL